MKNQILCGNALEVLKTLPDESVNCCVTSPPYFGLRDYGVEGQIGLEETVSYYILRLLEVFREVHRILKADGTLWINIADSYAGSGKGRNSDGTVPDSIYHCKEQFVKGRITGMIFKALTSEDVRQSAIQAGRQRRNRNGNTENWREVGGKTE